MRVVAVEMSQALLLALLTQGNQGHVLVTYGLPAGAEVIEVALTPHGPIRMLFRHDSFADVAVEDAPLHNVRFRTVPCVPLAGVR